MTLPALLRTMVFALTLLTASASVSASQKTADALLQEAINQELVAGDLPKAIELYKEIANRHASNRQLAAQALANLGRAYEKLGTSEARSAYEKLVRDYADQTSPVRFARERLVALGPESASTTRPATDGVYAIAYPDLPPIRSSQHAQYDFSPAGDRIVLRVPPDESDSTMGPSLVVANSDGVVLRTLVASARRVGRLSPRWSPDGKYIAFIERAFIDSDTSFATLNIVPAEGGTPRVIKASVDVNNFPAAGGLFWTRDGHAITLANRAQIITFDLQGNVMRNLPVQTPHRGQFTGYSPDGRWLAFHRTDEGSQQQEQAHVWIMPTEGGRAIQLTNSEGFDGWPTWSGDGRSVYFVSERSGSSNVWKIGIDPASGQPQGDPIRVTSYTDATIMYPRLVGARKLSFALVRTTSVIQVAATAEPSAHRPVTRGIDPALSPDGATVYYVAEGTEQPGIFSIPVSGGTPRRLTSNRTGGSAFDKFVLSPDGRSIAYFVQRGRENVLYTVPAAGGDLREVVRVESREHLVPSWSPDGERLAYSSGNGLYVIPATGGAATRIGHIYSWDGWTVQWSPDGAHVAALAWSEPNTENAVFVVPATGGEPRRLTPLEETGYKELVKWHPDSKRLSYMYYGHDERGDGTRVAYLDGRPTTLLVDLPRPFWDYVGTWHPNGRDYHFITSVFGSWAVHAYNDSSKSTRVIWSNGAMNPGAGVPAFSRDGRTMAWTTAQMTRQLWVIENPR